MQIKLAGFNIDKSLIDKLGADDSATPEVISAAYARISRSSKSVTELRNESLHEISKARASNRNIIFEMGHSSVAEHAVFNFDIIGISRYLAEFVQRTRLASFTEKSQRYVTLTDDFVIPFEVAETSLNQDFTALMQEAFTLYSSLYKELKIQKAAEKTWSSKRELEGAAKEDSRYILPLATKTQMGMTINARSLELLLRRLSSVDLAEAAQLRDLLYKEIYHVAPSLIRYTAADEFTTRKINPPFLSQTESYNFNETTLLDYTTYGDDKILSGIMFEQQGGNYTHIMEQLSTLKKQEKQHLWNSLFIDIQPWHKLPRAFELVDFTFELTMSSSCYAQFKRHRLCTILKAPYQSADGYVLPPSICKPEQTTVISKLLRTAEAVANDLFQVNPLLYPYAFTNAHRVRVVAKMNLREIYHFVRLRSDAHAQWEIREVSHDIVQIVKKHCPQASLWLMGKSEMPSSL